MSRTGRVFASRQDRILRAPATATALQRTGEPRPLRAVTADPRRDVVRADRLGHRVTAALRRGGPPAAAVQRTLKRWKPSGKVPDDYGKVDAKVREVDAAVDSAYRKVADQLKAGKPKQLDGVSDRRYATWIAGLSDKGLPANLKAAYTGYVIEDHATVGFTADEMVTLQVTGELRNSRPDVVVRDGSQGLFGVTGYLDITSTGDAGHVFDKEGNWGRRPYVAESLYPSIDFSRLSEGPLEIDEDTLRKVEEWRLERAKRRWKQVKKAYASRKARFEIGQRAVGKVLEEWSPERRKELRDQEPTERRRGGKVLSTRFSVRDEPYRRRPSRVNTKMRGEMEAYGIRIDPKGGIVRIDFDSILDAEGTAYTWEHIMELYGLT